LKPSLSEIYALYRHFLNTARRGTTLDDIHACVQAELIARYAD